MCVYDRVLNFIFKINIFHIKVFNSIYLQTSINWMHEQALDPILKIVINCIRTNANESTWATVLRDHPRHLSDRRQLFIFDNILK